MHCKHVSLDDLDEKLFEDAIQFEKQQPTIFNTTKRFPWYWKNSFPISNNEDNKIRNINFSSIEFSKRGNAYSQNLRNKENLKKHIFEKDEDHNIKVNFKIKKEYKENADLIYDNKIGFGSHLYNVLEEQFLGEIIHESMENLYLDESKSIGFHMTAALSTNTWY